MWLRLTNLSATAAVRFVTAEALAVRTRRVARLKPTGPDRLAPISGLDCQVVCRAFLPRPPFGGPRHAEVRGEDLM